MIRHFFLTHDSLTEYKNRDLEKKLGSVSGTVKAADDDNAEVHFTTKLMRGRHIACSIRQCRV